MNVNLNNPAFSRHSMFAKDRSLLWLSDPGVDFFRQAILAGVGTKINFDWHEPDQIELDVVVKGKTFDNAGTDDEKVAILKVKGKPVGRINLATLCSLAMASVRQTGVFK
jgi:hypothetical protein